MIIRDFNLFESIDDEVITSYIFGIPSGEVINLTDDEIVKLKRERVIKYESRYRAFTFLDLNRSIVIKMLGRDNTHESIFNFMKSIGISEGDYYVYDNLSIDVFCDVDMSQRGLTKIPFKFNLVEGDFDCNINRLETLVNAPGVVFGSFECSFNKIYTLIGGPKSVKEYFCNNNNLIDLQGFPLTCKDVFDASSNQLESLRGAPDKITTKEFDVSRNKLRTLKGGPSSTNNFNCSYNLLTTLVGAPKEVKGTFDCTYNRLINLLGVPICNKIIYAEGNKIDEFDDDSQM